MKPMPHATLRLPPRFMREKMPQGINPPFKTLQFKDIECSEIVLELRRNLICLGSRVAAGCSIKLE